MLTDLICYGKENDIDVFYLQEVGVLQNFQTQFTSKILQNYRIKINAEGNVKNYSVAFLWVTGPCPTPPGNGPNYSRKQRGPK